MNTVERYPNLFKQIRLGNTVFRNRIFYAPTGLIDLNSQRWASEDYIKYFERKAKGGCASVNIGECYVDDIGAPQHRYEIWHMKDHRYNYTSLGKLAERITRYGAVATCELTKPGIASSHDGETLYGPSDCVNPFNANAMCRAMTEEQILQTIDDFAEAALYAKNRGFGMAMVHAGHGWFIQQFFSPFFNKRTDRWGGSTENRARLAVAICDAIHKKCGRGFPVEMRISGQEHFEGGYDLDEGIKLAKLLDGHADLIHVSTGNIFAEGANQFTHPGIFGTPGCNVADAAAIKAHVSTPVATIGGLSDPDFLEEIIASGKADVVEMARGLICEPDMAWKLRTGREKEVRRCLRCFNCIQTMYTHGRLFCAINPESGKDVEISDMARPTVTKTVLVAGGGIAGMEAAITAAEEGHHVILCEKSDHLGGVLCCEKDVPFKQPVDHYIEQQRYLVSKADIDVRLNTPATPELAKQLQPDAIICALGAASAMPPIPGINGGNVYTADRVFADSSLAKGKTIVLGAGLTGLELAIYLAMKGKSSELVEMLSREENEYRADYDVQLKKYGIKSNYETRVKEIRPNGVLCDTPEGERFIEADTIAVALGLRPRWEEAEALSVCAGEFYQVGDCRTPKNICAATSAGWTAAKQLGRL